jgi:hypothetical protein
MVTAIEALLAVVARSQVDPYAKRSSHIKRPRAHRSLRQTQRAILSGHARIDPYAKRSEPY